MHKFNFGKQPYGRKWENYFFSNSRWVAAYKREFFEDYPDVPVEPLSHQLLSVLPRNYIEKKVKDLLSLTPPSNLVDYFLQELEGYELTDSTTIPVIDSNRLIADGEFGRYFQSFYNFKKRRKKKCDF